MFETPIITTDQSIDRVLAAGLPALLVFLNGDASPDLEQAMSHLARQNAGQLLVVKVKVPDSPASARRFHVQATPAVVAVRGGQTLTKAEAISGADLTEHAAYLLGQGPRPATAQAAPAAETVRTTSETHARSSPAVVTDVTFDQDVLRAPVPVLVDFWAPWCGPCRMVEPAVEKLAHEYAGRLRVAKVNVDDNPRVAMRYGVQSIPTMMVVKNGQVIDRWAGAMPERALQSRVAQWLSS